MPEDVKSPEENKLIRDVKAMLTEAGQGYVLITIPKTSIIREAVEEETEYNVDTNLIDEMFRASVMKLAVALSRPARPPEPTKEEEG